MSLVPKRLHYLSCPDARSEAKRLARAIIRIVELADNGYSFAQIARVMRAWFSGMILPWYPETVYVVHRGASLHMGVHCHVHFFGEDELSDRTLVDLAVAAIRFAEQWATQYGSELITEAARQIRAVESAPEC